MICRDHFEACLGEELASLIPLVEAALRALDKPGTRALRRKIDDRFNFLVHTFGTMQRASVPEDAWSQLKPPRYERVTAVWPAGAARMAISKSPTGTASASPEAAAARTSGLRLVVDNGIRLAPPTMNNGGAA